MKLFDAHFHIIDSDYPLIPNNGYVPEPFTCSDYLSAMKKHELVGGAVVSGSFQGFDQSYLLAALKTLGSKFIGVTQIPVRATDNEIIKLHAAGVRAVRFNLKRGGSEELKNLETLARRVYELAAWHVELYVDSKELATLLPLLMALPALSIDHLGLSEAGFANLLKLAEKSVRIKATGFGRVDFDIKSALKNIYAANPDVLMFGSDMPSTRAERPFKDSDISLIVESLGDMAAEKVLYQNAIDFYGKECGNGTER